MPEEIKSPTSMRDPVPEGRLQIDVGTARRCDSV